MPSLLCAYLRFRHLCWRGNTNTVALKGCSEGIVLINTSRLHALMRHDASDCHARRFSELYDEDFAHSHETPDGSLF